MKVLLFCNLIPCKVGAYERLLASVAGKLAVTGDRLVIAPGGEPSSEVRRLWLAAGAEIPVVEGWSGADGMERPWALIRSGLQMLRAERPDVAAVHFGNELPAAMLMLLARSRGIRPGWVWEQDQMIVSPGRVSRVISRMRVLAALFDGFVAVYEGGRESLLLRGVAADRITVIHNASKAAEAAPGDREWLRREFGIPPDSVVAVCVSSLTRRKRIGFLAEALALVRASVPGAVLIVAGEGPDRDRIEAAIRSTGMMQSMFLAGRRNDVGRFLGVADLQVHASEKEACAYAVTEGMSAGLPCVVTDAGAAREQVADGQSGFVVAVDDIEGFVRRWTELAADEALRKRMGGEARRRWERGFTVEIAADRYCEFYRMVAERRG